MTHRLTNPKAEQKYAWLTTILDTYYIADKLLQEHLEQIAKKGTTPACHQGCHACCLKPEIPFTEPELLAISWYSSEILAGDLRAVVKRRLQEHTQRTECPFLVDRSCSIYPVRPLICRQFLVKSKPCAVDEDILFSRPQDIVPLPQNEVILPVAMRLLDHYKFKSPAAKKKALELGFIVENARLMHDYNWAQISNTMDIFDEGA
jgi:uncharacterized protein